MKGESPARGGRGRCRFFCRDSDVFSHGHVGEGVSASPPRRVVIYPNKDPRYGFLMDGFEIECYYYESIFLVRKAVFLGGFCVLPIPTIARSVFLYVGINLCLITQNDRLSGSLFDDFVLLISREWQPQLQNFGK